MLSPRSGYPRGFDCEVCPQGGDFDLSQIILMAFFFSFITILFCKYAIKLQRINK